MRAGITAEDLKRFEESFDRDRANVVAMNAVTKNGIAASAVNVTSAARNLHAYSVYLEAGEITNQKSSGRCWMFAALNVMRLKVMEKLNLKNVELSQNYPLFFDKLEKANYFLENILDTLGEERSGRVVSYLLQDPVGDGGQWDMFRSLVDKYGVVPKDVYPETAVSENTRELRKYLTTKLRGYACALRSAAENGASMDELRAMKDEMMETVYRMLCISLGKPPVRFTWETRDKDNDFVRVSDVTPREFYREYVGYELDSLVTAINAPTADKPYGHTYTVQYLGSVREGRYPVKYLNLPMDELRRIAVAMLKDSMPVWFGSDVGQFSNGKEGILSLDAYNLQGLFDTDFPMNKAERLDYGESLMTHAMVLTGVDLSEEGKPVRWRVENSWGPDHGDKGYYVMSDEWFGEYAYQILLDRKYFTPEENAQFDGEPIVLAPWDPMGSLAR